MHWIMRHLWTDGQRLRRGQLKSFVNVQGEPGVL